MLMLLFLFPPLALHPCQNLMALRAAEESQKRLQSMEEAFTKLKQVTGVKNVEEMHEKFSNQKSNKLQLDLEVRLFTPPLIILLFQLPLLVFFL